MQDDETLEQWDDVATAAAGQRPPAWGARRSACSGISAVCACSHGRALAAVCNVPGPVPGGLTMRGGLSERTRSG
jgi:hypothetical protein